MQGHTYVASADLVTFLIRIDLHTIQRSLIFLFSLYTFNEKKTGAFCINSKDKSHESTNGPLKYLGT